MRPRHKAALAALLALSFAGGCRARRLANHAEITGPMPANTVMLSRMMQDLSSHPGFTQAFLQQIEGPQKKAGAALLTPDLVHHLRDQILGRNWQGLDRFPGWTMREINPTVRVVGHYAGQDEKIDNSATAGGAPGGGTKHPAADAFLDLGSLAPAASGQLSLDRPSQGAGFNPADYIASLGDGVTRGDGPNPQRAPQHADSARLAEALNRLALNGQPDVAAFSVELDGKVATTPEALVANLLATGHQVDVADSRYFANFGHLHYNGADVMMPFWVSPQIYVPGTRRPLLVPVSHAEYEWFITGPQVNAQVSFYFGIDGKAEFRTMDQLDQAWVMNRHAHDYHDAQAIQVTRLSAAMVRTYLHLHQAHPALPFGGYYAFGVCQDVVAAIELQLTGASTLFPNTADDTFFTDPADGEINSLIHRIPKDRDGRPPDPARIFGSLPVGSSDSELATISIPGLGPDLIATHDAWTAGRLERIQTGWRKWVRWLWLPTLALIALFFLIPRRRPII